MEEVPYAPAQPGGIDAVHSSDLRLLLRHLTPIATASLNVRGSPAQGQRLYGCV
jgi:hypothetical protein